MRAADDAGAGALLRKIEDGLKFAIKTYKVYLVESEDFRVAKVSHEFKVALQYVFNLFFLLNYEKYIFLNFFISLFNYLLFIYLFIYFIYYSLILCN